MADADGETAERRAEGIVDAAQHRAGEGVEKHAAHHVGIEIDDVRHHDAGHRADRGGEAPAQRQHPAHPDADQAAGFGVLRRRAHRQPQRGEAEEGVDQRQDRQGDDHSP